MDRAALLQYSCSICYLVIKSGYVELHLLTPGLLQSVAHYNYSALPNTQMCLLKFSALVIVCSFTELSSSIPIDNFFV